MPGSSNFKVFNPNLTNMMNDADYNLSSYRLNGAVSGLAPSNIHNKLYYQVTTFMAAMAESLANQGYAVSDSNYANLVTVFSSILNSAGGNLSGTLNEFKGANIASAATTNIGAATGNFVQVTGTTTITALGTAQAGARRVVNFTGALTLTHNATSLILPGGANMAISAGDTCEFHSLGSGNWECTNYQPSAGLAPAFQGAYVYRGSGGNQSIASGTTSKVIVNTVSYDTKNLWDAANSRILIPAGVSHVVLYGSCLWPDAYTTTGTGRAIHIYKNGALLTSFTAPATTSTTASQVTSAPIPVVQGDYFELQVTNGDTASKNISQDFRTFLSMQVLG